MRFKFITLIIAALAFAFPSFAEEGGVNFVEGKTFAEILQLAKQENKLVFMDCYTSWCGPCKMMTNKVFPQKVMGDYFNPRFICCKFDMEKGEGVDLKEKYQVKAFPTFLCLDGEGNVLHRVVGGDDKCEAFIKRVDAVNTGNSLAVLSKRYENGDKDRQFLLRYLQALTNAYDKDGASKVATEILTCEPAEILNDSTLFDVFMQHENDLYSNNMQYFLANSSKFAERYSERPVNRKLYSIWSNHPRTLITRAADGTKSFDKDGMERYKKELKKWNVKDQKQYIADADIFVAQQMGQWKEMSKLCTNYIKKYGASDRDLINWTNTIGRNCKDSKVRDNAAKWITNRIAELKKEEASNDGKQINNAARYISSYERIIASLTSEQEKK